MSKKSYCRSLLSFIKCNEDYILSIPLAILAGIVATLMGSIFMGVFAFTIVIYRTVPNHKLLFLSIASIIAIILISIWLHTIYTNQNEDFQTMLILSCIATSLLIGVNLLLFIKSK